MVDNIINWCRMHGITILRWSLAIVFLWFGILKLMPATGEAEDIGSRTLRWITGYHLTEQLALVILGLLEIAIGIGLLIRKWMPVVLCLLFVQLTGTLLPLIIFRSETWDGFLKPALSGHYIIKNVVLIAAGIVLLATVSKSEVVPKPGMAGR